MRQLDGNNMAKFTDHFKTLDLPYRAKRWRWKTLANPTEDCIGKKILVNASLTSNETLFAKMVVTINMFVM